MKLIAKQDFSWAHRGVQIEEFKKGQDIETDDPDLIRVSTEEGWAAKPRKSGGAPAAPGGDSSAQVGGDGDAPPGAPGDGAPAASGDTDTDPT